jgi:hypothetical protein
MHIWVDADACPKMIKDILFRAAQRTNTRMTLVANQFMSTPPGNLIDAIQVASGFDVADNTIVSKLQPGDLVITADIPLAAESRCCSPGRPRRRSRPIRRRNCRPRRALATTPRRPTQGRSPAERPTASGRSSASPISSRRSRGRRWPSCGSSS